MIKLIMAFLKKLSNKKFFDLFVLAALFLIAFLFRRYLISDNKILFWYDQGRDFAVARELAAGDLKLFGPRASGTHDTIYHGVLYYYLLAFLITIFKNNIQAVANTLGLISALGVVPIFLLSKKLVKNKFFAFLAALLYAFSFEAAEMGTWLSNPFFLIVTIPSFYYFLWLTFFENKRHYLKWCLLFLGISVQGSIHALYLFTSLLVAYWYSANQAKKIQLFNLKQLVQAGLFFLLTTATMLISQLKLIFTGIYPSLEPFVGPPLLSQKLTIWFDLFAKLLALVCTPAFPLLSIVLMAIILIWFFKEKSLKKEQLLILLVFIAPLSLLSLQERQNYHFLIGLSPMLLLPILLFLEKLSSKLLGQLIVFLAVIFYVINAFLAIGEIRKKKIHITNDQNEGALLADQYRLIDETYKIAADKQFTLAFFTTPYRLYDTWLYLYRFYGFEQYGFLPDFIGADQGKGVTANFLTRVDHPAEIHFSIYEPVVIDDMPQELVKSFRSLENQRAGKVSKSNSRVFGSLLLEVREKDAFVDCL